MCIYDITIFIWVTIILVYITILLIRLNNHIHIYFLISLKILAKAKSVHECDVSCLLKLPSSDKYKPLCHKNKLECGHSFEFCVELQPSFLLLGVMEMHFVILDTITIRLIKISIAFNI